MGISKRPKSRSAESLSLSRLVFDQQRITPAVEAYQYTGSGTPEDPYVVTWIPNDAGNPLTWSKGFKWIVTFIVAFECLAMAFTSSVYSGTIRELRADLTDSTNLLTAGLSLYVLGFALGPLLWAPLSELYGRQVIFLISFVGFTAFNAGCVAAQNIGQLLVLRFLAGSFGSSPLTNAGGVIADVFSISERGIAMAIFSLAPSMGPCLSPIIGGFTGENAGWRWVMGVATIFSGVLLVAGGLFVPETYAVVLLRKRAAGLSAKTGKVYKTKMEIDNGKVSPATIIKTSLIRPWVLLFAEPIVLVLSIYIAIVYGTLYLLFGAFPIVFQQTRGWSEGVGALPFLGVAVGMLLATLFIIVSAPLYARVAKKHGGIAPPEERLVIAMVGAAAVPIGMFWFAFTNSPDIHWISPVIAGGFFGFGLVLIFLAITNYLIDAYTIFAASVLAANSLLRSAFGAAFPMFTSYMYRDLGIHWASAVPAFLALACLPAPFILYKYGAAIRSRCTYSAQAERAMAELRQKAVSAPNAEKAQSVSTDDDVDVEKQAAERTQSHTPSAGHTTISSDAPTETAERRFEPIRQSNSKVDEQQRRRSNSLSLVRTRSLAEAAEYDANPYDIDRVNTNASVSGLERGKSRGGQA
jgi:multidrug resistance protein